MTKPKVKPVRVKFILYQCLDEALVTTPALEKKMLREYFSGPKDRDIKEYDRVEVFEDCVEVTARLRVF